MNSIRRADENLEISRKTDGMAIGLKSIGPFLLWRTGPISSPLEALMRCLNVRRHAK